MWPDENFGGFPELVKDGCRAETWAHIAGSLRETIILIEGPLKADIVHELTGQTVVAVAGVNDLTHLEETLREFRALGVQKIMTAFDMDFLKNPMFKRDIKT